MESLLIALRAAGESTRLRIMGLLAHGELTVSEITQILKQSQPRVSRHLKLLDEANLVTRFQEGTWAFYRLTDEGAAGALAQTIVDRIDPTDPDHAQDLANLEDIRKKRSKIAADYFSRNAAQWDEVRQLYVNEETIEKALIDCLAQRKIDNFLDIGTGTARMLEVFADRIARGIGVDLSQDMLTIARATLAEKGLTHCQARLGDMYQLPISSETQDAVIIHQVLHFADQPDAAIKEATRTLKPGGVLLVVDFAPHQEEILREEHAHRRLGFSDQEAENWASNAGLHLRLPVRFQGEVLTVVIWQFEKPGAVLNMVSQKAEGA